MRLNLQLRHLAVGGALSTTWVRQPGMAARLPSPAAPASGPVPMGRARRGLVPDTPLRRDSELLRVELDDELLLHRQADVIAGREALHRPLEVVGIEREPVRNAPAAGRL